MRTLASAVVLVFLSAGMMSAQSDKLAGGITSAAAAETIPLVDSDGTPLPVVLDKEVRIKKAGQPIHGKIARPVYAFDKLIVPAGSDVIGNVTNISGVSAMKRTLAAMDANFSPPREVAINFDQLVLPDGRRVALRTRVAPASKSVLQFAMAPESRNPGKNKKQNAAVKLASERISEKKQEISSEWMAAKKQFTAPGKLHRIKRLAISELPYHPQYLDAGTRFNAELLDPLDFGTESLTSDQLRMVGSAPPEGIVAHALLQTPLNSAGTPRGAVVEALMTEPLLAEGQLILPEGTLLKGSVLQVRPARTLHRNGQLRIVFHEILPPNSAEQKVEGGLEGVEAGNDQNLSLDSEGGAQATTSKTRYLTTGLSVGIAAFSSDDLLNRTLDGASGYHVIGLVTGALSSSRAFAIAFGVYGAGMSVYTHFLSRGHDVDYPKYTAMSIGFGSRLAGADKKIN